MHDPAERARHLAETGFADAYVEAFHTIFGIDISSGARTGGGPAESGSVAGEPADGAPAAGAPLEGAPAEGASPAGWMRVDRTVPPRDRKSTRLNSSHVGSSYAVFCLKKKIR